MMLALALAFAGLSALAAGIHRHANAIAGRRLTDPARHRFGIAGWALLALSLAPVLARPDWRIGSVGWIGGLAAAALLATLVVALRARLLPWVASGTVILAAAVTAYG